MTFKQYIKENLITQTELAQKLGVSQSLISLWCSGKCRPSFPLLIKLSKILNLTVDDVAHLFEKLVKH